MQTKALIFAAAAFTGAAAIAGTGVHTRIPLLVQVASQQPTQLLPQAIQQQSAPQAAQVQPQPAYAPVPTSVSDGLARWQSLRQSDSYPFTSYASFLMRYRGWPGETAMRRTAEFAIAPNGTTPPGEVIAFFQTFPPLTNTGRARHALALRSAGRMQEAAAEARTAWRGGALRAPDESSLLTLFGASFTAEDHDRRIEALLDERDVATSQRLLAWTSQARRPVYETRIAIQTRAPDADARLAALGSAADGDAGLLMDRAIALRNSAQTPSARALAARSRTLTTRPANAEKWYETLVVLARGAANDSQWTTVYQIASQIDDAYPAGTDVSERSYGERDEYTNLAWLGGTAALHQLGRANDAARLFERYARAAKSPQTRAKGFYWAGRAAASAGQNAVANQHFAEAARYPDQFYGQLAMERLGQKVVPPPATVAAFSPEARDSFQRRDLVQATRLLGQMNRHNDQTLFIRALAGSVTTDQDRQLAAEFGQQIGRQDLGVWVAREARSDGGNFYARHSFPEVAVPGAYSSQWSLAHGISRQESSFDRAAVSSAGALGVMQLMPGTANETARKLGMTYDRSRLTSDPSYNIMLGNAYFAGLMQRYGNYAPLAIAAYNAGPGNVNRWLAANGDPRTPAVDIVRWIEAIPIFETRNYVQRVLENTVVYDAIHPARTQAPEVNRLSWYLGKTNQPG